MDFEWDNGKNISNKEKHKIDFETAKSLWHDENRVDIIILYSIENRMITIGKLKDKLWTAIYTMRQNNIRIISVRRSRKREVKLYEKKNS